MKQAMINGTLVRIKLGEYCVELRTYSRSHRSYRRFLISKDRFAIWLTNQQDTRTFFDSDIYNFITANKRHDQIDFTITWLSGDNDAVKGFVERISTQVSVLKVFLQIDYLTTGSGTLEYLSLPKKPQKARLDFSNATRSLKDMQENKHLRRAFSKGIRDNFNYADASKVVFYNDCCNASFGFQEVEGCWRSSGGFILHESKKKTANGEYPYYYYSMHT